MRMLEGTGKGELIKAFFVSVIEDIAFNIDLAP